jgi:hypothetical protein
MLDLVLIGDQQIARLAITAGIIERNHMHRLNVNHQRNFPLAGFAFTLGATRDAMIQIRIEHETVTGRQLTELFALCF